MSEDADRDLSSLYRAGAREEPPSWLDESILAASRGPAVGATPVTRRRHARWQTPLALAAVLTLAVSLGLVMEDELRHVPAPSASPVVVPAAPPIQEGVSPDDRHSSERIGGGTREAYQKHMPATTQAPRPEAEPGPVQGVERQRAYRLERQAREELDSERPRLDDSAGSSAPHAVAPKVPSSPRRLEGPGEQHVEQLPVPGGSARDRGEDHAKAPEPAASAEKARTQPPAPAARSERAHEPTEPPPSPRVRAAPAAPSAIAGATPSPAQQPSRVSPQLSEQSAELADAGKTPQQWLREIEQLRREGREEQARAQLDQFLKRFPGYPLPPSLQ